MWSVRHKSSFLFHGKVIICSWDIWFFIFWSIPLTSKALTSWWELTHEVENIFEYIFWILNCFVMKLWQQDLVTRKVFREDFAWYGGLALKARPILVYKPTTINKKPILMSLWYFNFSKVYTETTQNSKHNLHVTYIDILPSKSLRSWNEFPIFTIRIKTV